MSGGRHIRGGRGKQGNHSRTQNLEDVVEGLGINPVPPHPYVRSNWMTGLMSDKEREVHSTSTVVVLRDKFPKARHHYLVLPKEKIDNLLSLTKEHLTLLGEMEMVAKEMILRYEGTQFRIGFHAAPSMLQLHFHVISQDFQSVYMKKPRHWNSFNTAFFLSVEQVREDLETLGEVEVDKIMGGDKEKVLASDMRCNKCEFKTKSMPLLKQHIIGH